MATQRKEPQPLRRFRDLPPEERLKIQHGLKSNVSPLVLCRRHRIMAGSICHQVSRIRAQLKKTGRPHDNLVLPTPEDIARDESVADASEPLQPKQHNKPKVAYLRPLDDDDRQSALPVPYTVDPLAAPVPTRRQLIDLGKRKALESANWIVDPREFSDWAKGMALVVSMDRLEDELSAADEMRPERVEEAGIALRSKLDQLADRLNVPPVEMGVFREEEAKTE